MGRVLAGFVFALIPLATSQGHDFLSKRASNLEHVSLNASAANVPETYCGSPISSAEEKCPHMSCCGTGVDGLKCPTLCSPVSDQCHEQQSTEHEPYYFDCQVCEHGNSGAACWPDFKYASPRSGRCHSDNFGDDGFYYIDCEPAGPTCLVADQVCGNNNEQSQACCEGLKCTPLLGGSAMKCVEPH